jgi:hypothetical protein
VWGPHLERATNVKPTSWQEGSAEAVHVVGYADGSQGHGYIVDERTVRTVHFPDTRERLDLRSKMEDNSFEAKASIGNIATTLAMCKGLVRRSREVIKVFRMSEWKEQSGGDASFGAWVAEQLVEKTECDVTEHLEEVSSCTAGKWKRRRCLLSADARQSWRGAECL